jgi:Mg2+ and Co2+ transporter CorA
MDDYYSKYWTNCSACKISRGYAKPIEFWNESFYKNNNGLIGSRMVSNCWINVECPTEAEKVRTWKASNSEAFYNDIEDIERPRIELENGWTLIIMRIPVKSNDVKLPFHTIPVGIVFKEKCVLRWAFINRNVNRLCYLYQRKGSILKIILI